MSIGAVSNSLSTPNALLAGVLGPGALSSAHRARPASAVPPTERVVRNTNPNQVEHTTRAARDSASARQISNAVRGGAVFQTNEDGDSVTLSSNLDKLSDEEHTEIDHLKSRDAEVRTHEQAHLASAGGLANGGAHYEYKTGPDGERYVVGGHVNIDTSPGRTPEQTLQKAQRIRSAALAPASPSGADRAVAAKASKMEAQARRELSEQRTASTEQSINAASGVPKSDAPSSKLASPRLDLVA